LLRAERFIQKNDARLVQAAPEHVRVSITGHIYYGGSRLKPHELFGQGEPGDAFYAVQSGSLKVSVREAFVLSRKLAELKEGDFFGEMALLDSAPRSATVTCVTQAKLFALKRVDFQSAIRENPEFLAQIKRLAADRLFDLKLDR